MNNSKNFKLFEYFWTLTEQKYNFKRYIFNLTKIYMKGNIIKKKKREQTKQKKKVGNNFQCKL